jgi:hypothetical protein
MNTKPSMNARFLATAATLCLLAVGSLSTAKADIVSSVTDGPLTSNGAFYWGETLVTTAGGQWDNLSFNFYTASGNPLAAGDIYLLSEQYLGTPSGLSSATPGYIAEGSASGGSYTFGSAVTVTGSTEYWVYTDTALQLTGDANGGEYYFTSSPNANFAGFPGNDINYTLTGTSVPEPTTPLLLAMMVGLVGLAFHRKFAASR